MPTTHRIPRRAAQPRCQLCCEEPAVAELGEERTPIGQTCIDLMAVDEPVGAES